MKHREDFPPILIFIIVLGFLVIGGGAYFIGKNSTPKNTITNNSNYIPLEENSNTSQNYKDNSQTETITAPAQNEQPVQSCTTSTPPSITVISPTAGATYTAGQNVAIKWKSCNVANIRLSLVMGGKDFGEITYPNPISASQGSYTWRVTNPAADFTGSNINSYQIIFTNDKGDESDILARSGVFSVQ